MIEALGAHATIAYPGVFVIAGIGYADLVDRVTASEMGKKNKNCEAPMATGAAVKKDIRNPDALRTRTSGSDAAREAKVQASTRQVFKAYAHAQHPHEPGAPLLTRDELVPDQPGFIVAVADFLSSVECARL